MWWLYIILTLLIIIAIFVILFVIFKSNRIHDAENTDHPVVPVQHSYFRYSNDLTNRKSMVPIDVFTEVMKNENIVEGSSHDATIYLFDSLNTIDNDMINAKFGSNATFIFGIKGTDTMVSKSSLVYCLRAKFDAHVVASMVPKTYIYGVKADMQMLYNDITRDSGIYIMKKNIQRQEGTMISQDPQTIFNGGEEGYVVVQRLLLDPFCINNHKINLRVYMFVVVDKNIAKFYMYRNGFVYYSPKEWNKMSSDPAVHITTGRMDDRAIYDGNPQTFNEVRDHIGVNNYKLLWTNIESLMRNIKETYHDYFVQQNKDVVGVKVAIYGCDIAPDESLGVKIMEINKGPDLTYKDIHDKNVKYNMVYDMFSLIGIVKNKKEVNDMILL